MSLLSKSEMEFLQGHKVVSKSYEYKLKSVIKKKLAILVNKEIPLLSSVFPNLDLTKYSKASYNNQGDIFLTESSKIVNNKNISLKHEFSCNNYKITTDNRINHKNIK